MKVFSYAKKPSPAGVAVSAFHNDRNGEPSDMKCDPHGQHPLSGGVADRLPFVQRLALILPDPTEKSTLSACPYTFMI